MITSTSMPTLKNHILHGNLIMEPGGFQFWKKVLPNSLGTMNGFQEVFQYTLSDP